MYILPNTVKIKMNITVDNKAYYSYYCYLQWNEIVKK